MDGKPLLSVNECEDSVVKYLAMKFIKANNSCRDLDAKLEKYYVASIYRFLAFYVIFKRLTEH